MSLQAVRPLGIRTGFPRCFSLLSPGKLHFAGSFACRLCVHRDGKFAIGYMKECRDEGGWQRQVNGMALI